MCPDAYMFVCTRMFLVCVCVCVREGVKMDWSNFSFSVSSMYSSEIISLLSMYPQQIPLLLLYQQ